MRFNMGMVVSYNNQNYVIMEIIEKEVTNGIISFLKIKNLINQEIITVDSKNVLQIELRGSKQKKQEENQNEITDTGYIESLFSEIGASDSNDISLFDLSGESSFTLDDILFDNSQNEVTVGLIQNFQIPETKIHLTPRRVNSFENILAVNETFSDLNVIGEIQTQTTEIIPTRILKQENKTIQLNSQQPQNSTEYLKNINFNNKNDNMTSKVEKTSAAQLFSQINENYDIAEKRMAEDKNVFVTESVDEEFTETLDKEVIKKELSNHKPKKNITKTLDEKHFDILETGPLNTKKLFETFNKQQKIQDNLKDEFNNLEDTKKLFGVSSGFNQDALRDSKIYRKFRIMSRWLATLLLLAVSTPIIGIFIKAALYWVDTKTFDFILLFTFNLVNLIDIVIIVSSVLMSLIFVIYLVCYLISISDKQYKKIAFYNFQLQNKVEIIDSIQEYNNESSIYLIKVHNEIKKIKKAVKKISDQRISSNLSKNQEKHQKISQ